MTAPGRSLISAGTALLLHLSAAAQEVRGTWIARDGLTSRAQITATLDQLAAANFNVVCVNVWSRGYTLHPSDVLQETAGIAQDPTFAGRDPLQEVLTEAHLRGIEVEAWFEYGFTAGWSGWFPGPSGRGPVLEAHPDWIAVDNSGQSGVPDGGGGTFYWFAHENPGPREFLIRLAEEIADRYDVDGIQFDRVRYPSTAFGYDPATIASYGAEHGGASPPSNPGQSAWRQWRTDKLSEFASELYARIKARRTTLRVTNAPVVMNTSLNSFLQDWPRWLEDGSLDLVYPQVYRFNVADYVSALDHNLGLLSPSNRLKVAPGIRAVSGTSTPEVLGMVAANRARGLPGHVFWYAAELADDLPSLTSSFFSTPDAVPGRPPGWRPPPLVAEDDDPSTIATAVWLPATPATASGGSALLAPLWATPADHVTFSAQVPTAGAYRALVHGVIGAGQSPSVRHDVTHRGGRNATFVDQSPTAHSGWIEAGTYRVEPTSGPLRIKVRGTPGLVVIADAIALIPSRMRSGPTVEYGSGTSGSGGTLTLGVSGNAAPGGALDLQVSNAMPNGLVGLLLGAQTTALPLFGGELLTMPLASVSLLADTDGIARVPVPITFDPGSVGLQIQFQAAALDPAATGGVSLSQAVAVWIL